MFETRWCCSVTMKMRKDRKSLNKLHEAKDERKHERAMFNLLLLARKKAGKMVDSYAPLLPLTGVYLGKFCLLYLSTPFVRNYHYYFKTVFWHVQRSSTLTTQTTYDGIASIIDGLRYRAMLLKKIQ